jgi:peptide deformylase
MLRTMAETLKIYTFPDPVLKSKAAPVENIDEGLQRLIDRMAVTMYAAPGIGLAANQVGETQRVVVYDVFSRDEDRSPSILINPEIVMAEGSIVYEEACLSVLDYSAEVERAERVLVRGVDRDGNPVSVEAEGLLAICLQHEIDHLNGVLYIDHISSLKRALYKKKLRKKQKKEDPGA